MDQTEKGADDATIKAWGQWATRPFKMCMEVQSSAHSTAELALQMEEDMVDNGVPKGVVEAHAKRASMDGWSRSEVFTTFSAQHWQST